MEPPGSITMWRITTSVGPPFLTSIVALEVPLPSTVPLTPMPGVADVAAGTTAAVALHSNTDRVLRMTMPMLMILGPCS